uniref:Reverse transcriptase zinc-binding domain-containing protein n=2 Tax=Brassica oleracea TaxID=3712 RepID=A0A0D3CRR4_BRAOL
MRYIIGDGTLVNMWTDPWIPDHPPKPPTPREESPVREKDEDVDQIFLLKISSTAHQDLMGWHYNEDGIYTVKFGYWLGTHLPTNVPPTPTYGSAELKYKIWKTSAPAKLKHFLWRLLSKSLATSNNLKRRHIGRVDQCKRCCSAAETEEHIFFECPYAKKIWRASGVSNRIINDQSSTLEEKIEA